jgi:hypothetical protein
MVKVKTASRRDERRREAAAGPTSSSSSSRSSSSSSSGSIFAMLGGAVRHLLSAAASYLPATMIKKETIAAAEHDEEEMTEEDDEEISEEDAEMLDEEDVDNLKALIMTIADGATQDKKNETCLNIYKRIMALSMEELEKEAAIEEQEEEEQEEEEQGFEWQHTLLKSVLHFAAAHTFPLDAIVRLVEAVGIDAQTVDGYTPVMSSIYIGNGIMLNELALMKADLSITNYDDENIFDVINEDDAMTNEWKEKFLEILAEHGATSDTIAEGFQSTLYQSAVIKNPTRLFLETSAVRFYMRAMTLSMEELAVEARESRNGNVPLKLASAWVGMGAAIERLHEAWPASIDAQGNTGFTAIMDSTFDGNVDNVHLLGTMGADLSLKNAYEKNVFDQIGLNPELPDEKIAALEEVLAEHGITSTNIPRGFQSPLYFESKYYAANLREQCWIERRVFMMCLDRVFKWSVANQIESERLMTLPADLSSDGLLIAKCCMHVDASSVSNGIARLIMEFAFGFNKRLIGMPREGAGLDDEDSDIYSD